MALNRLLLGIFALTLVCGTTAFAQYEPTETNQDGILIMDGFGRLFSGNAQGTDKVFYFKELEVTSQRFQFPFPVAKDVEFVADPNGNVNGAYVLDAFGGQFGLTLSTHPFVVTSPAEFAMQNKSNPHLPYFGFDVAKDIEIAPDWRGITYGYKGYFVLDADGVVHSVGNNNMPFYTFDEEGSPVTRQTLYPNTIDVSGSTLSAAQLLNGGPLTSSVNKPYLASPNVDSVTPIYLYFGPGSDVARDLEVSVEWVSLTVPASMTPSGTLETRHIAMTNGYYIMDGLGAVHSNRLPLDFNVVADTQPGEVQVTYKDWLDPKFGMPINNAPLAAPWQTPDANLPYFGTPDSAIAFELTPSGKGFYLLDKYGAIHTVGDARLNFPPKFENGAYVATNTSTPFFGFPIAKDIEVVSNRANPSLGLNSNSVPVGLLVIDGFGTVHEAGLANAFQVSEKGDNGRSVTTFSPEFTSVTTSPVRLPLQPADKNFVVGSQLYPVDIAPNFRDVTAAPFVE
ncbi:MAG: hypothetical protein RBU29_14750 [bacterium]|jgi:hypothetical protein|nr:hypothetical protein [bacterium]